MRVSQLISKLEELKKQHGDLDVELYTIQFTDPTTDCGWEPVEDVYVKSNRIRLDSY